MKLISGLLMLLIMAAIITFAALNFESVTINYLFGTVQIPLVVILLLAIILGTLMCALVLGFKVWSLKSRNKKLAAQIQKQKTTLTKTASRDEKGHFH